MKFRIFGRTIEVFKGSAPIRDDAAWREYLGGKGYHVSPTTALKVAAVYRCVDVVAKTMASLPLNLYRATSKGREKAESHRVYKLLHRLPNKYTTAYDFWHMYIVNLMLTSGAYARISRDRNGYITGFWNLPTNSVSKFLTNRVTGERYIEVTLGDKTETLYEGEYMYTPNLRFNSDADPENPIVIAADVLGLTMALNGFARDYFENGTNIGGVLEHAGQLSDEAFNRLKESWMASYSGIVNQHKWAILEEGLKATQFGRNPEESQALESRKFAVVEVCRMLGVPPHKVFDLERATFSNIEQMNIEYVQESIAPMSVRIEQTIYRDALTEQEQDEYYAKFNVNALLRGDIVARTAYYHSMRQDGIMNADEIRALEDMNDIEDGSGKIYAINGNMIPLSSVPQNLPKGALKNG
jgi:HK97 family phage portal protein